MGKLRHEWLSCLVEVKKRWSWDSHPGSVDLEPEVGSEEQLRPVRAGLGLPHRAGRGSLPLAWVALNVLLGCVRNAGSRLPPTWAVPRVVFVVNNCERWEAVSPQTQSRPVALTLRAVNPPGSALLSCITAHWARRLCDEALHCPCGITRTDTHPHEALADAFAVRNKGFCHWRWSPVPSASVCEIVIA